MIEINTTGESETIDVVVEVVTTPIMIEEEIDMTNTMMIGVVTDIAAAAGEDPTGTETVMTMTDDPDVAAKVVMVKTGKRLLGLCS